MTTILTKKKDTTGAPSAGDLTNSSGGAELAVNTADKRLYTKNSGGSVVEIGTNPATFQINSAYTFPTADGTAGQVLATNGAGALAFTTNASGDVVGPASATDNAIVRFDGTTGKLVQNSGVTIDDSNLLTTVGLSVTGNTTLGDASGDSVTINASTVSTPNGLNFDSNTLVVDAANNRVGIGTSSPSAKLSISGASSILFRSDNATAQDSERADFAYLTNSTTNNALRIGSLTSSAGVTLQGTAESASVTKVNLVLNPDGGNVGIGTTSLTFSSGGGLNVANSTFATIRARGGSSTGTDFAQDSTGIGYAYVRDNAAFILGTNNTERMRIDSSGNVGIGTSSPSYSLSIEKSASTAIGQNIRNVNTGSSVYAGIYMGGATSATDVFIGALGDNTTTYGGGRSAVFGTNASTPTVLITGGTEKMRIDSSGNLGLGVTPSTWYVGGSGGTALQIGGSTSIYNLTSGTNLQTRIFTNAYLNAAGSFIYQVTGAAASQYQQNSGQHIWYTAASGTAGNAISFTQAMTLDASGRLLIGRTSNNTAFGGSLQVEGTSEAYQSLIRYSSSAAGAPGLYLGRSKSATLGTNTIVASGDTLGNIIFCGANGTGYSGAAFISAYVDGTPGASADMPGRLVFSTSADGSENPTERMRINSSGNVGIGTTTPAAMLEVAGSSSVAALKVPNVKEVATVSATAATGTINFDITTQSVLYYTSNASANWTVNFRGSSGTSLDTLMSTGESMTATFLVTQGATAYYNSAVTIDGSAVTPKWQGGSAPTSGNANSIDVYTYAIVKTGSATYTVFASVTQFA